MSIQEINKKISALEKKVEILESKLIKKRSSDLRNEKWDEFQSIIRLQQKNNSRKSFN
mgnify:CR=1 FL=1